MSSVGPVSPFPPSQQKPPPVNLEDTLKKLLKQADKDGDGELNQAEFTGIAGVLNALAPPQQGQPTDPTAMFTQADANHDGKVSMDELKSFMTDRLAQNAQAMDKNARAVQSGKASAFSSTGLMLSPDMQMNLLETNLTNTMAQRQGAVAYAQGAASGNAYSASAYFQPRGQSPLV